MPASRASARPAARRRPNDEWPPDEKWEPVFEVGTEPYECPTVEALERELEAMTMWAPPLWQPACAWLSSATWPAS